MARRLSSLPVNRRRLSLEGEMTEHGRQQENIDFLIYCYDFLSF